MSSAADGADYRSWSDWRIWQCIGRNEQRWIGPDPDPWGDGIAWHGSRVGGTAGSSYPGGLGISRDAWRMALRAGAVRTTNGAHADPAEQIAAGRYLVHRYGNYHGWSTHRLCGV